MGNRLIGDVPQGLRRSMLARTLGAILTLLLALLVSYGLWTVYENTLTPAALDQRSPVNAKPSRPGELSATAARALQAYGGEALWKAATGGDSTVTVGGRLFKLKGAGIRSHATITADVQRPHTVLKHGDTAGDTRVSRGL